MVVDTSFHLATSAAVSGVAAWTYLHTHPLRGDYAAPFYLAFTTFGIHVAAALGSTLCYRLSPWHSLAQFPGPFLWRISSLQLVHVSFTGKRYLVLDDLHRKYGPFVRIGPSQLSVNLHSASNVIYGASTHMEKGDSYVTPGHLGAVALFFKQKTRAIHLERKRIWSPAFTGPSIANFVPAVERRTQELIHCINRRQSQNKEKLFDLSKVFCHWAYDIMCEMVFGGSNNLELMENGDADGLIHGGKMATIVLDCVGQSPWLMDLAWHLPMGKTMVRLKNVAATMMRNRVKADAETTMRDLTSYLLDGRTSSGDAIPLTDLELEAVVAIQGGSDNTSTTLSLAFYHMLISPYGYYSKLQQELDHAFPQRAGPLDWDILAALPYLNAYHTAELRSMAPIFRKVQLWHLQLTLSKPAPIISIQIRWISGSKDGFQVDSDLDLKLKRPRYIHFPPARMFASRNHSHIKRCGVQLPAWC
ncbi:Cytochrome P450 [Mycena venus]|uniref:Cytochrome P450 n=1 Tax=Mycena venus TaxID=2733690 RepID=A0A8H7CHH7_9AGAR|nr:Cytochrome P450 [Mycena venus]